MRVTVITPPAPFVDLDTAKAHLRVTTTTDDALIAAYVAAACAHIDGPAGWLGRAIGAQTLEVRFDGFPWERYLGGRSGCDVELPCPPVASVTSVKYLDSAGVEQTLATDQYEVRGNVVGRAYGVTWPVARCQPEAVRIRYQAGYADIPAAITAAVLLMVGDLYAFRETAVGGERAAATAVPMSMTVEALLSAHRVFV